MEYNGKLQDLEGGGGEGRRRRFNFPGQPIDALFNMLLKTIVADSACKVVI